MRVQASGSLRPGDSREEAVLCGRAGGRIAAPRGSPAGAGTLTGCLALRPMENHLNSPSEGPTLSLSLSPPHSDVAPAFTQLPADTTVTDGMTATLRCEVSGAPRPAITWRRGRQRPCRRGRASAALSLGDAHGPATLGDAKPEGAPQLRGSACAQAQLAAGDLGGQR